MGGRPAAARMRIGALMRPSGIEPPPLSHDNNFELLKFVFAYTVLLVHSYTLSRKTEPAVISEPQ